MNLHGTYALDVSMGIEPPCWVPIDLETGEITFGMSVLGDSPPGAVTNMIVSQHGQEHAHEFVEANEEACRDVLRVARESGDTA